MNRASPQRIAFAGLAFVLVHLGISTIHGAAHRGATVGLTTFGNAYVVVVITLAPLVAAVLLFTRLRAIGALLLALSMLGSFSFGFWYHFLSSTNDNVAEVHGPWHFTFLWSAIALAMVELAGVLIAVMICRAAKREIVDIVDTIDMVDKVDKQSR